MPPTQVSWALLVFTLPREPSAPRVAVWRKLKKLGAVLLHDAVWVLPAQPALLEHFRWLAAEIRESSGEALVWVAEQGLPGQDDALIAQFHAQAEAEYQAILAALDASTPERKTMPNRACGAGAALSAGARARLLSCLYGRSCTGATRSAESSS